MCESTVAWLTVPEGNTRRPDPSEETDGRRKVPRSRQVDSSQACRVSGDAVLVDGQAGGGRGAAGVRPGCLRGPFRIRRRQMGPMGDGRLTAPKGV